MTLKRYEPTNEARAEAKLAWTMPCKEEEDEVKVSEQEFRFMTEGIAADLIQLLVDREGYSLPQAVEAVYGSDTFSALLRPVSGLYAQSSGYVYQYLIKELKKN